MAKFKSSFPEHQISEDWIDLHPSAAEIASGTGTLELRLPENTRAIIACLDVTVVDAAETLDVSVETLFHTTGGDAWMPVIHFTQAGAAAVRHYDKIVAALDQATFNDGAALAAGAKRHHFGGAWRCTWVISVNGPFNFSVTLQPM